MWDSILIWFVLLLVFYSGMSYEWLLVKKRAKRESEKIYNYEMDQHRYIGQLKLRDSEWPMDAEEYWEDVIKKDMIYRPLNKERTLHHMNVFASHLLGRQKRDLMNNFKKAKI